MKMKALTALCEYSVSGYDKEKVRSIFCNFLQKKDFNRCEGADIYSQTIQASNILCLQFLRKDGCHAIVRGQPPDLLTLDLHFYTDQDPKVFNEFCTQLHEDLSKELNSSRDKCLPAIQRGCDYPIYLPTADNLLIQYDFTELVFEADTPYQNVKILRSPQYGNMLILDDDPNLAESDLAYTQAITGWDHQEYADKNVLILGGGDGGILHELRKKQPKFITMVDIDGVVVEAAKKHLRGICYDSLDQLTGSNYEVLIADCVPILQKYKEEGRVFDFVINDLTAIPCTTQPVGNHWDFLRLILNLSMDVLAPTGKYYTQGNGKNMTSALRMYEEQLEKLQHPVDFRTKTVCVPSYQELWVFYEIWKKSNTEQKS